MKEIIIKVEGMACSGCENRIQNAVKQIEGVEQVEGSYSTDAVVNIGEKEIVVKLKPKIGTHHKSCEYGDKST